MKDYNIELAFLGYSQGVPEFTIYRKEREPASSFDGKDVHAFSLPVTDDIEIRKEYWVSLTVRDGFEAFRFRSNYNRPLTIRALNHALKESARFHLSEKEYDDPKSFYKGLSLNFTECLEGTEQLVCEPYYLRELNKYGWLLDFHFRLKSDISFSRKVQQLSLSLDRNYKRNPNAYIDRREKILQFFNSRKKVFDACSLFEQASPLTLDASFSSLKSSILQSKLYFFANNKTNRSQYAGLKEFGPLQPLQSIPKLVFVFEERYRFSARKLAVAIKGAKDQVSSTFPGFKKLFKSEPLIDSEPVIIPDSSLLAFQNALEHIKRKQEPNYTLIPILVLPNEDDNGYLVLCHQ